MRIILFRVSFVVTLCTLVFGVIGCAKSEVPQSPAANQVATAPPTTGSSPSALSQNGEPAATTAASTGKGKIDACALLTSPEIRSVQGEPLKETKASGSAEKGFLVSQCFFTLATFNKSISLAVTQKGEGAGARDPKEFWEATFDKESESERKKEREKEPKKDRDKNREEEEEAAPPQKVAGVGDEAFWTGSRVGGALYVLKGNAYLRVSVGGSGDQQSKINKSKALAQLALKRL